LDNNDLCTTMQPLKEENIIKYILLFNFKYLNIMAENEKVYKSKHQTIVRSEYVYDENGEIIDKKLIWDIPEFITSDVTFQLLMGFPYPKDLHTSGRIEQSYGLNKKIKFKNYY